MLGLKQSELAAKAGISKTGLINIESGNSDPKVSTLVAIKKALESAGVEFTNGDQPGVRLKEGMRTEAFEARPAYTRRR
jgi:predicted transcriptional regulator